MKIVVTEPYSVATGYGVYVQHLKSVGLADIQTIAVVDKVKALASDLSMWDQVVSSWEDIDLSEVRVAFPGSDAGVQAANTINMKINSSLANRNLKADKWESISLLEKHEISSTKTILVTEMSDDVRSWLNKMAPVYLKPLGSSGGDRVYRVNAMDAEPMTEYMLKSGPVMAQTEGFGQEYMIDVTSYRGRHVVLGVWKPKSRRLGQHESTLIDRKEVPNWSYLEQYLERALTCTGVEFGVSHVEVMWDGNHPYFFEINYRHHGHMPWRPCMKAIGTTPIKCNVDMTISEQRWERNHIEHETFPMMPTTKVWIHNQRTRWCYLDEPTLNNKRSVSQVLPHPHNLNVVRPPAESNIDSLGCVIMQNEDKVKLASDVDDMWRYLNRIYS